MVVYIIVLVMHGHTNIKLVNPTPNITTLRVNSSFVTDYRTLKMRRLKGPSEITFTPSYVEISPLVPKIILG